MPHGWNGWVGHFAKHLSLRSECSVRRSIEWKIELNVLRQSKATSKTSKYSPCLANYVMLCFSIEWSSMGGHSGPQNVNGALEFGLNTKRFSTFDSWLCIAWFCSIFYILQISTSHSPSLGNHLETLSLRNQPMKLWSIVTQDLFRWSQHFVLLAGFIRIELIEPRQHLVVVLQ